MPSIRDIAREYVRAGLAVVPLKPRSKKPYQQSWQGLRIKADEIARYFPDPDGNVGVLLGDVSGGLIDFDLDSEESVRAYEVGLFPNTGWIFGRASKPVSHLLYRVDGDAPKSRAYKDPTAATSATLFELRSNLSQTMFPGSVHPEGEAIDWVQRDQIRVLRTEDATNDANVLGAQMLLARYWPEGTRHYAAMHIAGALAHSDWELAEARAFVRGICLIARDAELDDRMLAVETTFERFQIGDNVTGWPSLGDLYNAILLREVRKFLGIDFRADRPTYNDIGNAERFLSKHGRDVLFVPKFRSWYIFGGTHWKQDAVLQVQNWIGKIPNDMLADLPPPGTDEYNVALKWANQSGNIQRLRGMEEVARSQVALPPESLDQHTMLFNTYSGTIDLTTGGLLEHNRDDMLTKLAPVWYDPDAECPNWEAFLLRTFGGDEEFVRYVQRVLGYAMTGEIGEKVCFFMVGPTDTGKTTFTNVIKAVFGPDYYWIAPESFMEAKQPDHIPNDLAAAKGARFALLSETREGMRLNEARLKQLTGGGSIAARFLHAEWFDYEPHMKFFIETNHKPLLKDDPAVWRRIHLIPFVVPIDRSQQIQRYDEILIAEAPGILAWIVRGALMWQEEGLNPPPAVTEATDAYREEMDVMGAFLDQYTEVGPSLRIRTNDLFVAYSSWLRNTQGERAMLTQQLFRQKMGERGFLTLKSRGVMFYKGIALKTNVPIGDISTNGVVHNVRMIPEETQDDTGLPAGEHRSRRAGASDS